MGFDGILVLKSLATGLLVGILFTWLKLPIPAPPALAGVVGIVGVYLGFILARMFLH